MFHRSEIQFVYPTPPVGGSKLIFFTPFRDGVNEEKQVANLLKVKHIAKK
jgi:hypothetical protein